MFLILRRWIAGLLLTGLAALAGFILRKAFERIMAPPPQQRQQPHRQESKAARVFSPPPSAPPVITDTLWEGMDSATLLEMFGPPDRRDTSPNRQERWSYQNQNMTVTLINGRVTDWADLRAEAA
jgi:hypothetical protein